MGQGVLERSNLFLLSLQRGRGSSVSFRAVDLHKGDFGGDVIGAVDDF